MLSYLITNHQGFPCIKSVQFCSPHTTIKKKFLTLVYTPTLISDPRLIEIFEKRNILFKTDSEELRLLILHLNPSS